MGGCSGGSFFSFAKLSKKSSAASTPCTNFLGGIVGGVELRGGAVFKNGDIVLNARARGRYFLDQKNQKRTHTHTWVS